MSVPTAKEARLLAFLEAHIRENGFSPTVRQMREALGYRSNSPIQSLLEQLERQGWIERERGKSRTVRLRRWTASSHEIDLCGTIAAGGVVEPFPETAIASLPFPIFLQRSEHYALRVLGDSMIDAHICSGDYVILRSVYDVQTLRSGSIVAARVDGEGTTLKHFHLEGNRVVLQPANRNFQPIEIAAEQVQVQGVLVSVWREYTVA